MMKKLQFVLVCVAALNGAAHAQNAPRFTTAAVDQGRGLRTEEQHAVAGQPAPLKHGDAGRQCVCHGAQASARWMMIFCTSLVPS